MMPRPRPPKPTGKWGAQSPAARAAVWRARNVSFFPSASSATMADSAGRIFSSKNARTSVRNAESSAETVKSTTGSLDFRRGVEPGAVHGQGGQERRPHVLGDRREPL